MHVAGASKGPLKGPPSAAAVRLANAMGVTSRVSRKAVVVDVDETVENDSAAESLFDPRCAESPCVVEDSGIEATFGTASPTVLVALRVSFVIGVFTMLGSWPSVTSRMLVAATLTVEWVTCETVFTRSRTGVAAWCAVAFTW